MRRSIRALAAVAAVPLLLTTACSTTETPTGGASSTGAGAGRGPTLCKPDGSLTDVYKRPKVNSSGNVTAAVEEAVHDYNNNTSTANSFANSLLSLAQPSAFFVDSNLGVCVDGDVMSSVTEASTDPLSIVYKIRPDAVWSDGKPVSCHDFYLAWLASASAAKSKDGAPAFDPASSTGYDQMKAPVCSDDDKTVTTTYTTPFGDYRSLFAYMMPAHIVEAASKIQDVTKISASDNSADTQEFAANYIKLFTAFNADADVSAGPFLLKSRTDEQSVLVRNDKWWGNAAGPESLTIVTNADGQSEVQSLQNQEVQVISPQPDAALAQQLRALSGVTFVAKAGATYEHIDFNMKLPMFQGAAGKALREATFLCVDRSDIITKLVKQVNPDTVPVGNFIYLPNEPAYVDHYADYKTGDVDKAKQVMEAAGWKLGSDGVYALDGKEASFRLGHKVVDNRERIAQLVGSSCAKAGIKVTDDQDVNFNAKRLPASDFDTALFAWVGNPFKSSSTSIYTTGGGANYNGYANETVDKLFKEGNSSTDQTKQSDLYNQMDAEMAKDLASIPLYQFSDMIAHTSTLSPALSYDGVSGGPFWNAFEWELQG
ncbi:ABC transporter family substrate-binding protein [uncultured Friedmanniella sp.]|uniref:ABC transporter family substrate-binding protein n=1 Tax=uncultured Friedmanniella sp. TaxID=335381 RepID=UPI0035CB22B8